MRVGSTLPKMETKSMVAGKYTSLDNNDDLDAMDSEAPSPLTVPRVDVSPDRRLPTVARTTPPSGRVTGKRSTRDEPTDTTMSHGMAPSSSLDMSTVSSLCHELMERKRIMLSQGVSTSSMASSPVDADGNIKVSDEDSDSGLKTNRKFAASPDSLKSEPITEEDIQKRKAQRRREQVRAASRRCRDRQRRETEDLRVKVMQLEEFITHTMQTYETELRRQRQQIELLTQENDTLRSRLMSANRSSSVASSPASVGSMSLAQSAYAIKPEPMVDHQPQSSWTTEDTTADHIVWDPARMQNMHETVEDCKRAMIAIAESCAPVAIHRQAFGWTFDFWAEDTRYFCKTGKFFRGLRARDVADRNFHIDNRKYIETFPEVKEKKVLHHLSPSVHIVQTVKDLPARGIVSSLTASMMSRDEEFEGRGERWTVGVISVGSANHLSFTQEDECNGYIFEDAVRVTSDGREVHGCLVRGAGRFLGEGKDLNLCMEEMAKIFASVVIRWESLFINDYMTEEDDEVVGEIAELDF